MGEQMALQKVGLRFHPQPRRAQWDKFNSLGAGLGVGIQGAGQTGGKAGAKLRMAVSCAALVSETFPGVAGEFWLQILRNRARAA